MIYVKLTNGFGNNLFQYIAGRLLAEHHKKELVLIPPFKDYYGLNEIIKLGLKFDAIENKIDLSSYELITGKNYLLAYINNHNQTDLVLEGYFEDYTYYYDHFKKIKTWFPFSAKRENNDLVVHIRMGDRLFYQSTYDSNCIPIVKPKSYLNAIKQFEFERLFIITDMPFWKKVSVDELIKVKYHITLDYKQSIDPRISVSYFNSLVDTLQIYDPIVRQQSVSDDFSFMRSFNNILFQHSTTAWWAAVLSDANNIGVYGPWRSNKNNNKNLSNIPLKEWFQWE